MITFLKRFGAPALLVMSLVTVSPSYGQFVYGISPFYQVRRGLSVSQYAYNQALVGKALQNYPPYIPPNGNPYLRAFSGYGGGYGSGYSPYINSYYDPSPGNTLRGAAELTRAGGEFIMDQQHTLTMREQRRGERIKNDRAKFDLAMYMRERTPGAEELRLHSLKERVIRSRNNPPVTEITSAKALNDLMQDIHNVQARGVTARLRTFNTMLSEDTLGHVNVTQGQGNIGLLKNDGRLTWPVALSSIDFKEDRERINSLVRDAVSQAGFNGQVDSGTISQLITDRDRMRMRLRRTGTDLQPSLYIGANAFLNNLDDAIRALQQPDVGSFFTGKYAIKAKTIPELVNYMTTHGLQFAPAVPVDESAYIALQQALAAYDLAINPNIEKEVVAEK